VLTVVKQGAVVFKGDFTPLEFNPRGSPGVLASQNQCLHYKNHLTTSPQLFDRCKTIPLDRVAKALVIMLLPNIIIIVR